MSQCDSRMLSGGQCDLDAGHEGEHRKQYPAYVATWTDEQTALMADKYGSRFD